MDEVLSDEGGRIHEDCAYKRKGHRTFKKMCIRDRVRSSSRMAALVEEVLWRRTMAPGWIRPRSFLNASSFEGCLSWYQST